MPHGAHPLKAPSSQSAVPISAQTAWVKTVAPVKLELAGSDLQSVLLEELCMSRWNVAC